MTRRGTKQWNRAAGAVAALALIASACGGDDDTTGDGEQVATDGTDAAGDTGATGDTSDSGDEVVATQGGSVLAAVQERDVVNCGGNNGLAGFGSVDAATGEAAGFDIDFCRALAAAVLGDASKVEIKPLEAAERFPTLQSGEIDVLIRNTTWTASRDGAEQATFLHTNFYDGQGFMVAADSGIAFARRHGERDHLRPDRHDHAHEPERDVRRPWASRSPRSSSRRTTSSTRRSRPVSARSGPRTHRSSPPSRSAWISRPTSLPDIISKEPLGPAVADGDSQWAQIVDWTTMATIQAWEWGITSENVDDFLTSEDSNILTFLGQPVTDDDGNEAVKDLGLGLLDRRRSYQVIKQVGNYQEIFERNLTPIGLTLAGSPNDLWTNGGLMYNPPFR